MYKNGPARREMMLSYISDSVDRRGYPPTLREIADFVNLRSMASVHYHLTLLVGQGLLRVEPVKGRAYWPVHDV